MKKSNELDINYYVNLAVEKVGFVGKLDFQSRRSGDAGTFEILEFIPYENPTFYANYWKHGEDDTPTGAYLGTYKIRFKDSKFYNGKVIRCKVSAYVQDKNGVNDRLYIWNINEDTGKGLKAYEFPILNW